MCFSPLCPGVEMLKPPRNSLIPTFILLIKSILATFRPDPRCSSCRLSKEIRSSGDFTPKNVKERGEIRNEGQVVLEAGESGCSDHGRTAMREPINSLNCWLHSFLEKEPILKRLTHVTIGGISDGANLVVVGEYLHSCSLQTIVNLKKKKKNRDLFNCKLFKKDKSSNFLTLITLIKTDCN